MSASSRSWASSTSRPTRSPTGALPRRGRGDRSTGSSSQPRARRSSTSAASRRGRAPNRSTAEEELHRVLPVIAGLAGAGAGARISIDTSKAEVAAPRSRPARRSSTTSPRFAAIHRWPGVVAERGVDCCLMHMLGEPRTMQDDPRYDDVVDEVKAFLEERMAFAVAAGIAEDRIMLDPGIGFGKTVDAQPRAAAPARRDRRDRPAGRDRHLAQVVPRPDHRPRRPTSGCRERSRRTCSRTSAARACSASTTSRPSTTRCSVAAATVSARWKPTTPTRVRRRRRRRRGGREPSPRSRSRSAGCRCSRTSA